MIDLVEATDESRYGGKGVQLGASLRAGLPVPPGFAIAFDVVERIVAGDPEPRAACEARYLALGGTVAVRSSAVGEDGAGASFAGQHATKLGVAGVTDLFAAIAEVRDSGFAESALAYRRKLGIAGDPRVGVVVQRLIAADSAGVMFTKDPITGEDVRLIEGAWGLGETVVQGLVDPDRFRVARGGAIVSREIGDKSVAIRAVSASRTEEAEVPEADRHRACLDDAQLRALDALATTCDRVFPDGRAHDIEWAVEDGRLYLLQRRAITR